MDFSLAIESLADPSRWWGIAGLVLVIAGLLYHCGKRGCSLRGERVRRNTLFAIGGVCLLVYSVVLEDLIFAVLQVAFTLAAMWELYKATRQPGSGKK